MVLYMQLCLVKWRAFTVSKARGGKYLEYSFTHAENVYNILAFNGKEQRNNKGS